MALRIDKDRRPTKLLWLDMEMTGLDPKVDRILEVAAIITDFNMLELGQFEACITPNNETLELLKSNDWWSAQASLPQLIQDLQTNGLPEDEVEATMAAFVSSHFGDEPAVLAGNSIHNDRLFIKAWWPKLDGLLHYRIVDVSSFKIIMQSKYDIEYEKKETHRALDDVRESIEELKLYQQKFV